MIRTIETCSVKTTDAIEMKVSAAVHAFHAALTEADEQSLELLLSKDLSYGHSNGVVEDKQTFIENIVNGNSVFLEIALSDQSITTSGDTAVVRHQFNAKTNDKNVLATVALRILLVWQKQDEQWQLLARQAIRL